MPIFDPMMMRAVIMDHYENPRNKEEVNDSAYSEAHMNSSSCIDDIYVQVKVVDGVVEDVKWRGTACAISTASTSIMSELVKGKTLQEAKNIMENFLKMLDGESYDADLLQEAQAFQNTGRQPSRIGCATIGWRGLFQAIGESVKEDSEDAR